MQFLKKLKAHYDKIVLGVVLLAVAVMALFLTQAASSERGKLDEQLNKRVTGKQGEAKAVDLAAGTASLERLSQPAAIQLAGEHKTFNPITWVYKSDGTITPAGDRPGSGTRGLVLTATQPLNLSIQFSMVAGTTEPYRYQFSVTRDYERKADKRRPTVVSLTEGTKNDLFVLREVHGPKDNPTEVVIELLEGGEVVTLPKEKVFTKGLSFAADLTYPIENRTWSHKRVDEAFVLSSVSYKIVAIAKDEIVVSAPNRVRTTIKLSIVP